MATAMKSHALIIEDDKDTASLFSHILEFIGFKTDIVQSGEKALVNLRHNSPDIVLLDIKLSPNVSGLNILDYIRRDKRLSNSRIIVITGHPNLVETIGNQADLVLLKPISAKQLSTMVLRLCPDHICENFLYNASYDALTGLMNHARFKDRLTHAIRRTKRVSDLYFAVLIMQIGDFGKLKRRHGELLVNQVLLKFVEKLSGQIREVDTFSRLSEDKFAILLENINEPCNANIVADRIRGVLDTPFEIQGVEVPIDVSMEIINENLVEQVDAFLQS
jgi:diguanylate cyclase (GGDEF)-like protein